MTGEADAARRLETLGWKRPVIATCLRVTAAWLSEHLGPPHDRPVPLRRHGTRWKPRVAVSPEGPGGCRAVAPYVCPGCGHHVAFEPCWICMVRRLGGEVGEEPADGPIDFAVNLRAGERGRYLAVKAAREPPLEPMPSRAASLAAVRRRLAKAARQTLSFPRWCFR